jgi:hypothetical protein
MFPPDSRKDIKFSCKNGGIGKLIYFTPLIRKVQLERIRLGLD